jgi:hypothetical protein
MRMAAIPRGDDSIAPVAVRRQDRSNAVGPAVIRLGVTGVNPRHGELCELVSSPISATHCGARHRMP